MERTQFKDGVITVGEEEFTSIMKELIHAFQFMGDGEPPSKIILPAVSEIDGVVIAHEVGAVKVPVLDKTASPTLPPHPLVVLKEVQHAIASGKPNTTK